MEKTKQFHTQTNLPFNPGSDEEKTYCQSCGTNLELKSQSNLCRHGEERLVKMSDQNTQGVRRSKSQTEGEQNCFPKTKRPGFSPPSLLFVIFFMDVPPYPGAKNIRKYLCEFFQRNTDPE